MTMTSLPAAEMGDWLVAVEQGLGVGAQEFHGEMDAVTGCGPSTGQIAGLGRAGAEDDGVEFAQEAVRRVICARPRCPVRKMTPSSSIWLTRRRTSFLSSFMLGMPYMRRPPTRSARSKTVTKWPARLDLGGGAEAGGAGTDHGHFLAGADGGGLRPDPALGPSLCRRWRIRCS